MCSAHGTGQLYVHPGLAMSARQVKSRMQQSEMQSKCVQRLRCRRRHQAPAVTAAVASGAAGSGAADNGSTSANASHLCKFWNLHNLCFCCCLLFCGACLAVAAYLPLPGAVFLPCACGNACWAGWALKQWSCAAAPQQLFPHYGNDGSPGRAVRNNLVPTSVTIHAITVL